MPPEDISRCHGPTIAGAAWACQHWRTIRWNEIGPQHGWTCGTCRRVRARRPRVRFRVGSVRHRRRHRENSRVRLSVAAVRRAASSHDARGGGDLHGVGAAKRGGVDAQATRAGQPGPGVLSDLGPGHSRRRPDWDAAAAVHLHRGPSDHLRAVHADGGRLRGLSAGSRGGCARGAARRDEARRGLRRRLPGGVDRNRRRHGDDPNPAGIQRQTWRPRSPRRRQRDW